MTYDVSVGLPPESLSWRIWPVTRNWPLSGGVAIFALGLSAAAMWSFGSGWYAFITLAVLTAATARHYFPTRYHLTGDGVAVVGPTARVQRPWSAFRAVFDQGDRLVLSPVSDPASPLVRRRGVTLLLGDNPAAVREFVQSHLTLPESQ
jgi:hypothetical protein